MTTDKAPSHKDELLRSGTRLFYRDGFNGTTVDAVLAAASVPKGSFYHHFGSKESFAFAALDRYDAHQQHMLGTWSTRTDLTASERLAGYHAALVDGLVQSKWTMSCLVSKFSNELAVGSPRYRDRLAQSMRSWCDDLQALLADGQESGEIRDDMSPDQIAWMMLAVVEGGFVTAPLLRERDYLAAITGQVGWLIEPGLHAARSGWKPKRRMRRAGKSASKPPHREQLIRTGLEEFFDNGYHGTTVDRVLKAANVPKGSFYHHFGSKDAFAASVIESYDQFHQARLTRWTKQASSLSAPEIVLGYYTDMAQIFVDSEFRNSDLVGKLASEIGASDDSLRDVLAASVHRWRHQLETVLAVGQARAEVRTDCTVEELSATIHALAEGGFVVVASTRDTSALPYVADAIVDVLTPRASS